MLGRLELACEFDEAVDRAGLGPLRSRRIEIFQINVGKLCNMTCRHCHVDAGPDRTAEMMSRETVELRGFAEGVVSGAGIALLDGMSAGEIRLGCGALVVLGRRGGRGSLRLRGQREKERAEDRAEEAHRRPRPAP